jgi:chemotaxis protein MotB
VSKAANGPIIIKKVKKADHASHHGGAWKVAYADFVTAMMAFFLLLWLLNVTTDEQKRGIADYFEPSITWHRAASGADALLAGQAAGTSGAQTMAAASPAVATPAARLRQHADDDELDNPAPIGEADELAEKDHTDRALAPNELAAERALEEREEQQFAAAEFDLRQAIQDLPEANELAESLIVDRSPEGLRIQLVDQERTSMFPLGSSEMRDPARKLMALVAQIVARLPNKISVTGHTDAMPYAATLHYSNWELSTDRANASRRQLVESGLPLVRIAKVSGVADREPLIEAEPGSPRNRRISIVLLREAKTPAMRTLAR